MFYFRIERTFLLDCWSYSGYGERLGLDRFIALRALAFHGEGVEPPRQACGVSIIPLFPLESSALRFISLFGA
ncbi:hypothetical protein ACNA6I_01065 [Rossellomorea sp. FS2]|uniref:hypothetical protein n=1 Tax=Rossellomorea TaxID=2837508 RepID=UPI00131776FD|nr:hypothetical protein [Rossellomorea marisflavi]QHA37173.1 hypothetical protein D5E69_16050 [Rossellomorea marisflavi]